MNNSTTVTQSTPIKTWTNGGLQR